jgi:hypothetical protein
MIRTQPAMQLLPRKGIALAQHEFNKRFWKVKTEKGGGEPH